MLSVGQVEDTTGGADNNMRLVVGDDLHILLDVDS
jgi:hypothetical protein